MGSKNALSLIMAGLTTCTADWLLSLPIAGVSPESSDLVTFPRATTIPQGNEKIYILVAICPPKTSKYSKYEFIFTACNTSTNTQCCLTYKMPYSLL